MYLGFLVEVPIVKGKITRKKKVVTSISTMSMLGFVILIEGSIFHRESLLEKSQKRTLFLFAR